MAIQPARPIGSAQRMVFNGTLIAGEAIATYPKTNATYSSDATTIGGVAYRTCRLGLFDATALTDLSKQLPLSVFDDCQPAVDHPMPPITGLSTAGFNATDQVINARTWCQNARVTVRPVTAAARTAVNVAAPQASWLLDTATSGLGLNTGLPVAMVYLDLGGSPAASIAVEITVEITPTHSR